MPTPLFYPQNRRSGNLHKGSLRNHEDTRLSTRARRPNILRRLIVSHHCGIFHRNTTGIGLSGISFKRLRKAAPWHW